MSDSPYDESPRAFVSRVGDALLRTLALVIFGVVHWLLEKGIRFVVPSNLDRASILLEDVSFVFFALIYVYLLWDMLKVFIPWINVKLALARSRGESK